MQRLTDLASLDEGQISAAVAAGQRIIIQYSKPIYTPELLKQMDRLCAEHEDRLEIRFYSHYSGVFDFRVLDQLPHVQRLSTDCLNAFSHLEALFALPMLQHLCLGAYADMPADLLAHPNLTALRSLTVGEAKKPSIDLAPLAGFSALEHLNVVAHHRGIAALEKLPRLQWLSLSRFKKTVPLDFISRLSALRTLRLILGGRDGIDEVVHPTLRHLEIIRVQGLAKFLPANFPGLHFLQIEDQIRLTEAHFTEANRELTELRFLSCKSIATLTGLKSLSQLGGLRLFETAISFEALLATGLPPALEVFAFYTGKTKLDRPIRQQLDALGYREKGEFSPR